jgi:hypothetical protein
MGRFRDRLWGRPHTTPLGTEKSQVNPVTTGSSPRADKGGKRQFCRQQAGNLAKARVWLARPSRHDRLYELAGRLTERDRTICSTIAC